jgi:hypothetical protein
VTGVTTPGPPRFEAGPTPSGSSGGPSASDPLLRPLAIGGLRLERPLFMAPMAG